MKKVIRIILITVLAVVILVIGGCAVILGIIGHKGKNYWKYAETGGDIETKYTALGKHEVFYKEYDAKRSWSIYHRGDLLQSEMMIKTPEPVPH